MNHTFRCVVTQKRRCYGVSVRRYSLRIANALIGLLNDIICPNI